MTIQTYIAEAEATRRYSFRLKTVVPMDDAAMVAVERTLAKYMPHSISRAKKTPIQQEPLDFRAIQNAEVWIIDFVLTMPGSAYVLQQDVRNALNIPDKYIIIRSANEPGEQESWKIAALAEIDAEAEKLGLCAAPILGDEEGEGAAADPLFGDEYNRGFLGYLRKVQTDRAEQAKVATKSPLFTWVADKEQEPAQSTEDFNAGIKDAPHVGVEKEARDEDEVTHEVSKVFLDKNGKRVVLTRKVGLGL